MSRTIPVAERDLECALPQLLLLFRPLSLQFLPRFLNGEISLAVWQESCILVCSANQTVTVIAAILSQCKFM